MTKLTTEVKTYYADRKAVSKEVGSVFIKI